MNRVPRFDSSDHAHTNAVTASNRGDQVQSVRQRIDDQLMPRNSHNTATLNNPAFNCCVRSDLSRCDMPDSFRVRGSDHLSCQQQKE